MRAVVMVFALGCVAALCTLAMFYMVAAASASCVIGCGRLAYTALGNK